MSWEGQEENYNFFRWYRSGWGRYTQVDPVLPAYPSTERNVRQEISSTIYPYAYAGVAPLNSIDPLGHALSYRFTISTLAKYHELAPAGPPGSTYKGCIYVGPCVGNEGTKVASGVSVLYKYAQPDCACPLWCTYTIDNYTKKQ